MLLIHLIIIFCSNNLEKKNLIKIDKNIRILQSDQSQSSVSDSASGSEISVTNSTELNNLYLGVDNYQDIGNDE